MPTGILQTVASYVCNGGVFLTAKYFPAKQLRTAWVMFGIIVGMISAVFLYVLPLDNYNGRLAALYCLYFYLGHTLFHLVSTRQIPRAILRKSQSMRWSSSPIVLAILSLHSSSRLIKLHCTHLVWVPFWVATCYRSSPSPCTQHTVGTRTGGVIGLIPTRVGECMQTPTSAT